MIVAGGNFLSVACVTIGLFAESGGGGCSMVRFSEAASAAWAKSPNDTGCWLPLWRHMADAADVAGDLFDTWLPESVVRTLSAPLDGDVAAARSAMCFLAGLHDVGKATPAFAVQCEPLAQHMRERGLDVPAAKAILTDRLLVPHAVASYHLFRGWLVDRGWSAVKATAWAVILASHHGVPPDSQFVQAARPPEHPRLYGDGLWSEVHRELIDLMVERTGVAAYLDGWAEVKLPASFQVLASGVAVLADWIASNEHLHPYFPGGAADPGNRSGVGRLHLPSPWRPKTDGIPVAELFDRRFRLPDGAQPRPVQLAACEVAGQMPEPGMVVIEAPMGEGKTEAALAAAEIMAHRWGAGGVQVALPTQATTDAMFDRVVAWLDTMEAGDQPVGAITLSHGKARFNRLFRGLVEAGVPVEIGCDEVQTDEGHVHDHSVVAHSWLAGRKKSQLANFVVGTIDQLLFAALRARHLMLRHLALAGKVVVIDEIHAYDVFMNSYLLKVLTWLGAYGVPVVALSATLPADRRGELLAAYQRGRVGEHATPDGEPKAGYPLITWTEGPRTVSRPVEPSARRLTVHLGRLRGGADDEASLIALLRDRLSDGGCAVVVRNTVSRVLRTAASLSVVFPGEVSVAHSRFIAADRMRIDAGLLRRFGPPVVNQQRPQRHIVVASQVVEQSLDVDFDLLVTDLAPVDLVLQRIGRLHRHLRGVGQCDRPEKLRTAQAFVTGVDLEQGPPRLDPGAAKVYGEYPLLRTAAVLRDRFGGVLELPTDIAPLVAAVYGPERIEPDGWCAAVDAAHATWCADQDRRAADAQKFQIAAPSKPGKAILGWVSGSVGETDDDAQGQGQVRDGEPSLEVVVVQHDDAGNWHTPAWLEPGRRARPVPRDEAPDDELAAVLASCTVRLPASLSDERSERALRAATPRPWASSPLLYRLPVLVIDRDGWGEIAPYTIRYTPERGLEVRRP
ncbi:CRISPR-associated helicase Cas3' [Mycolicibacterium phlei]|uniref:CRISPR-associated helicase Cas3' n=1 Tax=Mycolicibacterium phlei TaxID=1771 RepID=UPI001E37C764|nr:CRISPR-associated helicase Cas3' [Mycolicibacterium phlei]